MIQEELFERGPGQTVLPRRIEDLYTLYGKTPGRTCGECKSFLRFKRGASWAKCQRSRMTSSVATDWRSRWEACGLFEDGVGLLTVGSPREALELS